MKTTEPQTQPGAADDPNDPDLCVCGALIVSELVPTLKEVRERLVVIERRVGALEGRPQDVPAWMSVPREVLDEHVRHDHVCVFVDGFDRCSWCGVAR